MIRVDGKSGIDEEKNSLPDRIHYADRFPLGSCSFHLHHGFSIDIDAALTSMSHFQHSPQLNQHAVTSPTRVLRIRHLQLLAPSGKCEKSNAHHG